MTPLIVVDNPEAWPVKLPGAEVVRAREYLTDPRFVELERANVFNLCRSYAYQTVGYYVSLLAAARGHRPLPSITTLRDMRQSSIVRIVGQDLDALMRRALKPLQGERFTLSIYFGRNLARRYDRLCQAIFNHFPVPLLRAEFVWADEWRLSSLKPIAGSDVPEAHREFLAAQAKRFFARPRTKKTAPSRYDLAILHNPDEVDAPSGERALQRFVAAAERLGMSATLIDRHDYGRVAEFDALFIRETTSVNHHTYRFASRAATEGMVVMDDPESIVRCSNKVYQAELFERHGIDCPRTLVVHRDNADQVAVTLGCPCVLKRPDSSFSAGVAKAESPEELRSKLAKLFKDSELIVAQQYVSSDFDWRVGVLNGEPLWVAKYFMARGHWQIQKAYAGGRRRYGKVEAVSLADAPRGAVATAVRAARLIGNGLYGVDVKEVYGRFMVMEVNDNPNIDAGYEDAVLGDALYEAVMRTFYERLEGRGRR